MTTRVRVRGTRWAAAMAIGSVLLLAGCAPSTKPIGAEPLDLPLLIERTTEFQRQIIGDGVVTSAEYERALLAQRDCVIEAGATPGEIYETGNNELTFDFEAEAATEEELHEIERAADACLPELMAEVGAVWVYQQLLSPTEQEQMRPLVLACLEETGLKDLADDATLEDMLRAVGADNEVSDAEAACMEEFSGFFSTWRNPNDHDHESEE